MVHIENLNTGIANIVEGDMMVYGGQQGSVVTDETARNAARDLRGALAAASLSRSTRAEAQAQASEIEAAVQDRRPDKSLVAGLLQRLTQLLAAAGSLASTGAAVLGPLHALATWLGAPGAPVLALLPG